MHSRQVGPQPQSAKALSTAWNWRANSRTTALLTHRRTATTTHLTILLPELARKTALRLAYIFNTDNAFEEIFEIAEPNSDFQRYSHNRFARE